MEMAQIAATQVLIMFLLMAIGYICRKIGMLSKETGGQLSKILLTIVTPAILMKSFAAAEFSPALLGEIGICALLALITHAIAIALAYLFLRGKDERSRIERFASIFANNGFMGIPLIAALVPDGVIFASTYIVVSSLVAWSAGVFMLVGKSEPKTMVRKALVNPGTIGTAIGLILFVIPWELPGPILSTIHYVADLNTPLAMFVVGAFFCGATPLKTLRNPRAWLVFLLRLVASPLIMIPVYLLFRLPYETAVVNVVIAACPSAALVSMFAAMFGLDETYACEYVTMSTALSIITLPTMVMILSAVMA